MKHLLLTTIAAVVLVGCGEPQQSTPPVVKQQSKPLSEADQLLEAAASGNVETVKTLLVSGVDVNGEEGWTPLHATVSNMKFYPSNKGHKKIIELLLEKGADVNAKMENGKTPLDLTDDKDTASLLQKHGGKRNRPFIVHGTAPVANNSINDAAFLGDIGAVKQHLAAGADVNVKGGFTDETPLVLAAGEGHKKVVELLITNGADVNAKSDILGKTPLHFAAQFGHKKIGELYIAKGADVNAKDEDRATPLCYAATRGHKEIAELLINEGADVNTKIEGGDYKGITPLDLAIGKNQTETIDLLRKHGGKTGAELKAEGN
jgi:ankyrin repeat protein